MQGAQKLLKKTTCIYFESDDQHFSKYGYDSKDIFNFLYINGFRIFFVRIKEKSISQIPNNYTSKQRKNLLALKSVEEFLARTGFALKD